MDTKLLNDTLYNQKTPEINSICNNEIAGESEQIIPEKAGWSPKSTWSSSVRVGSMASIEARPRRRGTSRLMPEIFKYNNDSKSWDRIEENCQVSFEPPESLPAFQALCWTEADQGVDYRPHLFDQGLNQHLLVDSGSMVSAFPPDPGDVEVNNSCLKAVNGSRIKCYGQKRVSIKIGRKTYHLDVYKADWFWLGFHS